MATTFGAKCECHATIGEHPGTEQVPKCFSITWVVYHEAVLSLLLPYLTRVASCWRTMELVGEQSASGMLSSSKSGMLLELRNTHCWA